MKLGRFWILAFTLTICSYMCGVGLQYKIYPMATTFATFTIITGTFILVDEIKDILKDGGK